MGNLTLLQMTCCKNTEDHVHSDRKGEEAKAAQTCVVRWNPVPVLAAPLRTLLAPAPSSATAKERESGDDFTGGQ